jgi:ribosomal protein S18 acetylase RimI-like enzyme
MVSLQPLAVDDPRAHALLSEYFRSRELGFAHQNTVYTATFPDPSAFTPPAGVFVLLLDDDGADVGCGGIRRIADDEHGIRYEVKHLYLKPETRGRGWGRLLLSDLESRARAWDAAQLVLDTHHSLEAAAGLYRAAGFDEIERFNDNPNATRWYRKPLRGE